MAPMKTLRGLVLALALAAGLASTEAVARQQGSLSAAEAWTFLSEAAPSLAEAGLAVVLPAELTRSGRRRLKVRMRVGTPGVGTAGVVAKDGGFGLDDIVDFRWEAAVGETSLTAAELDALARRLGAWDTHAVTPSGLDAYQLPDELDDTYQVTSAYDMALIFSEALKYERFRQYITTKDYVLPAQPQIAVGPNGTVDLVLNGDTFELPSTEGPALAALDRILAAHSAEMGALSAFAKAGSNRVVVIPGDADAALRIASVSRVGVMPSSANTLPP